MGAGLPAIAVLQSQLHQLADRYRGQARSHIGIESGLFQLSQAFFQCGNPCFQLFNAIR